MNIFESMSFIRKRLNISQGDMLSNTTHSTYSRIESGKRQIKLETLLEIADRFGMNHEELFQFFDMDNEYQQFIDIFRTFADDTDDETNKEKLLTNFFPKKDLEKMDSYELTYYFSIKGHLGSILSDIGTPTAEDQKFIVKYLTTKSFYTQKDYQIGMNIITHLPLKERIKIMDKMYPVILPEKRTPSLKRYANHMMTNLISICIYKLEYETAMKYIEIAENTMDFSIDYYLRLNILYHKNVVLRFLKQDTVYITQAREIIKLMYAIGDPQTAKQFETDLNKLTDNPKEYQNNNNYPRTVVRE